MRVPATALGIRGRGLVLLRGPATLAELDRLDVAELERRLGARGEP